MRSVRARRIGSVAASLLVATLVAAGCSANGAEPPRAVAGTGAGPTSSQPGQAADIALSTDQARGGGAVVAAGGGDAPYNYGPAVMADGAKNRMWWCSQNGSAPPPGDDILYGESTSISGPFRSADGGIPRAVLSGKPGGFDGTHTCDPSVIRVDGTYYLYYTGAAGDHAHGNSIGLATSTDGLNWFRANEGRPIVNPAHDVHRDNTYGAGQPAAVYLDGWFYLMFTDTSGKGAGWNGAGQFVLRAKDPAFARGVEAAGANGFYPVPDTKTARLTSLVDAFSADLMWVDALDAFAIAHETAQGTTITFWNRDFTVNPFRPILVPGPWQEGPGLVREPDGHAPPSSTDPCARVPVDLVRATVIGNAGAPTDLRHFGLDIAGVNGCPDPARTLTVLNGVAMPNPVRTMDLVLNGKVLRVDRRSVATALAGKVLDKRVPALDTVPITTRLPSGAPAFQAPGTEVGLVLEDGRLWRLANADVAGLNGSFVNQIGKPEWESYPVGEPLAR